VSKNGLALMHLGAVERKSRAALDGATGGGAARPFLDPDRGSLRTRACPQCGLRCGRFFQIQRVHHGGRQRDRQAVPPLRHLNNVPSREKDIHGDRIVSTGEVRRSTMPPRAASRSSRISRSGAAPGGCVGGCAKPRRLRSARTRRRRIEAEAEMVRIETTVTLTSLMSQHGNTSGRRTAAFAHGGIGTV